MDDDKPKKKKKAFNVGAGRKSFFGTGKAAKSSARKGLTGLIFK